jgi:hypothetical protein
MGFFSWNCKCCGHPMMGPYALAPRWMNECVVKPMRGKLRRGSYDGCGRLDGVELPTDQINWETGTGNPDCYHEACWKKAGRPAKYTGGSEQSDDQGYFFRRGAHDMKEPV